MEKFPITKSGEQKLTEKLRKLKTKDRPEISQAIAEARAHGDLKENAEYHAAKEQQGHCLLYTSPSPRDLSTSRMPSSA